MRATIERAGGVYKVHLRGNVADSRPILKWVTAPASGRGREKGGDRKPDKQQDVDLDLGLSIVTGNNDL